MKAKLTPYGERSILIEEFDCFPNALTESLQQSFPEASIRIGLESVVITFTDYLDHLAEVKNVLDQVKFSERSTAPKLVEIPTRYNGKDLGFVVESLGLSVDDVIALHQSLIWEVKLVGFAPGFPYLVPLNPNNVFGSIGRLETPRTKVPAGSIGIAAGMSCIYPSAMPGGWQLIGTTDVVLFDAAKTQPNLLCVGDQVQFIEVKP